MKREVVLRGARDIYTDTGRDPGTSPYPNSNTPGMKLFEIWNNVAGGVNGQYAYVWPNDGVEGTHRIGFEKGPTLTRFTKITIRTGWDRSARNGWDPWGFPGKENASNAYGPIMAITLQKRSQNPADWLVGTGAASYTMTADDGHYVSINQTDGYLLHELSWEMTSHPEGGPWTLEDINNLGVGIQCWWSYITEGEAAGHAFETVGNAFHKLRIPYLSVTLEVEDLGGYVENVRSSASLALRLMRRARNILKPNTFIDKTPGALGSRIYLSHPRGPGALGWGPRRLERRAGLVLKRTYSPEGFMVEDEVFDLHAYSCLGWAAYRIDTPWNPELQGLALIDKGMSFVHGRAQDAWSPRPGDSVLFRVLGGYPNLSFHGLTMCGGGDTSICLQNYDLQQSGWSTVASSGDFAAAADTTVSMAEEQGYLSASRLTYGAGGGRGGRERSLGTLPYASGDFVHVRVIMKNSSVPVPATQFGEWYLKRRDGGLAAPEFWKHSTREWTVSATYNPVPSDLPFGEVVADAIPCNAAGATSDPTYVLGVGRFSGNMGPVILHGALTDVQHSTSAVPGARPPLVVLDTPIVRVADSHRMPQELSRELWNHERGTAVCEVQPFWRAVGLPAGAVKPLLHAQHASGTWDALQFVAKSGDDVIRLERAISGEGTFQLDCPITNVDLTRLHVLRAWVRWLGSEGWNRYGPYSVEVGYSVLLESDGSLISTGSILGSLSSQTSVSARSDLYIGCDLTRQLDGYVRMWETRRNPLDGLEAVWRI